VSALCGIGFTMSLFIGELAFPGTGEAARLLRDEAKIGILAGSIVSALAGYAILRLSTPNPRGESLVEHTARA
jgi:Na+:H+ antiporter, NhaA family